MARAIRSKRWRRLQSAGSRLFSTRRAEKSLGAAGKSACATQIGIITLVGQLIASLLQPLVGLFTDRRPVYFALPAGMASSVAGLILLSRAPGFGVILLSVGLIGLGSAIFHPEAARIARLASGGRYGFAQSLFSLGGTGGSSLGPLLAAFIVLPNGQRSIAWFSGGALVAMILLARVSRWYKAHNAQRMAQRAPDSGRGFRTAYRLGNDRVDGAYIL
jgi:MFS transporter, FSR family, fosmidomycin resistance protein